MKSVLMVLLAVWSLSAVADKQQGMPAWAQSLSAAQGEQVAKMHHQLEQDQQQAKQREQTLQQQLNNLAVAEQPDMAAIEQTIDALMAAKAQILKLRYAHIVEMRAMLTPEQRQGYDQGVLTRHKIH